VSYTDNVLSKSTNHIVQNPLRNFESSHSRLSA